MGKSNNIYNFCFPIKNMKKKRGKEEKKEKKETYHPIYGPRTFGQKSADNLTKWAGSWTFIISFLVFVGLWMYVNVHFWVLYEAGKPWDPYPFILLNLVLSCLAAIQAPIILMSQNRQAQRDRLKAEHDLQIDKKAEKEIQEIKKILLKRRHHH